MNEKFLENMKELLGDEYDSYFSLLDEKPYSGLRINTLKIDKNDYLKTHDLQQTNFYDNSYYCEKDLGDGYKDDYMLREIYYQEPSASSAVNALDIQKGSMVLDLCAAPGSKSTQILEILDDTGILVSNEFNHKRANILKENIIRHGASNCVVLSCDTNVIKEECANSFDYVLVDAPCSGEGMMRKNDEAISQWSERLVESCANLQIDILNNGFACLKNGGELVYSTCTFNKKENEELIEKFMDSHDDAEIIEIESEIGRKSFPIGEYGYGVRIFPMDKGEGHFAVKIRKTSGIYNSLKQGNMSKLPKIVKEFINDICEEEFPYYYVYNDRVYGGHNPFYDFGKCHVLLNQIYIGEIKKNRFEPSFQFFNSSKIKFKKAIDITKEELDLYLRGEAIPKQVDKGWYVLRYHSHNIGGVKSDGKILKNHFPKEYRRN